MNKQCTNCPGRTDHTTAECPIRARFEAYMLGREHPVIGWIDAQWFRRGDDPATYANDYVQGCWVMWRSFPGVPDGWSVYRDSTGAIYVGVASGRLPGVWLYRDGSAADRMLWAYFDEVLDAAPSAPAAQSVTDHSQRALIRLAMNLLSLRNHVPGSDVDLCVKALADLLDGKHSQAPEPSEAWRGVAEIAQAETPAVAMPPEIPRNLLGKIVDEVFAGAIEDASVIEDVYRVIVREQQAAQ